MDQQGKSQKLGVRLWLVFILVGLAGQFAWAIENMYLNSYLAYLNFTAPKEQAFDYNMMIAITTAASAVVATLTTLIMGTVTDKVGHKRLFISLGYIVWGIATAAFGLCNVTSDQSILKIGLTASAAAALVVVLDCVMTFFGSTSNDASFNSLVTSSTDDSNRGKVEGVLSILPLVAMLAIFVGLNNLTAQARWDLFFYIVGGLVTVVGIIAIFLIPKEQNEKKETEPFGRLLIEGFRPSTIKANKTLYLVLLVYVIYSIAVQVYFPYLMVYINMTCKISNTASGFLSPFAIVMAVSLLLGSLGSVVLGFLSDKFGKEKMTIPSLAVLFVGLLMLFFVPYVADETGRTVYCALSGLVMILGYVGVPTIINSLVRQYIPKGKEGTFMGVRMIFVVALPMCIGPFIGSALNKAYGSEYTGDYGVTDVIPTQYGYIAASLILLLALIPVFFMLKSIKEDKAKQADNAAQPTEQEKQNG